jgi:hypothetical protein
LSWIHAFRGRATKGAVAGWLAGIARNRVAGYYINRR